MMFIVERYPLVVLLWAAVSSASEHAGADVRTWTDSTGKFHTQAELVDTSDGVVRLKKTNGQIISLPVERLSAADRAFLRQQAGPPSAEGERITHTAPPASADALIELRSGAKIKGRMTARDENHVTVETTLRGRRYFRKYTIDQIEAISVGGKREVLSETAGGDGGSSPGVDADAAMPAPLGIRRSPTEIDRLIDQLGRTPPDWWDSVPLDYPHTLDLSWPPKPPPPWNAQKNVGQYLWDIIQPNPGKWRQGIRFIHYLLERNAEDREKRTRAMTTLGRLYYILLQDYARAAFWWRQAGIGPRARSPNGVLLAECYWRLGNKQMALDLLAEIPVYYSTIKLLADMGETANALRIAEAAARGGFPDLAYLYAGDACRIEGRNAPEVLPIFQQPQYAKAVEKIPRPLRKFILD